MPTNYPSGLDAFSNPLSTNKLNDAGVIHSEQHTNANDAIEAIEAELGLNPKGSSATVAARLGTLAPIASPTFTGIPAAPTATANTNTTQIATTAYVIGQGNSTAATITSLGTQAAGTSNLYARADHVHPTTGLVTTSSLGTGVATFLATPTSANLISAVTDETGTGTLVFSTSPAITTSITTPSTSFALVNTTATTVNFAGASTTFNMGGTPTTALTANIFTNATANAVTKTINFATGGASGSTTNINLGSATSGALGNIKFNAGWSIATPPAIITGASYSATINDTALIFNTTASSTLTLPAAATYPGKTIMLKQLAAFTVVSATANVKPLTSDTAGTAILSGAGKFAYLVSDGTNWVTMMAN